jgi:hypothetical protein
MSGFCELQSEISGSCGGRYVLPPFASQPKGWPIIGWHGEHRKLGLHRQRNVRLMRPPWNHIGDALSTM